MRSRNIGRDRRRDIERGVRNYVWDLLPGYSLNFQIPLGGGQRQQQV